MTEFKHKNAIVRMHGDADVDKLGKATICFMKKAIKQKKETKRNENQKEKTQLAQNCS